MRYKHVTFMLSLPRSRSAWMADFVRPFVALSLHNPLQQCDSIKELGHLIDAAPEGRVFIADVAALFFFEQLLVRFPGAQYLFIHRPAHEVEASIAKLGLKTPLRVRDAEKQLLEIAQSMRLRPDVMAGTFFELNSPEIVRAIAQFVTGVVPNFGYYRKMKDRNVQVPVEQQARRTDAMKQRRLFASAKIYH